MTVKPLWRILGVGLRPVDPIDFCTVLGLPQIVIPSKSAEDFVLDIGCLMQSHVLSLGKNPYKSRIAGETEYATTFASLAGPRVKSSRVSCIVAMLTAMTGSGIYLIVMAENALMESGWPVEVLKEMSSFSAGKNKRHVDNDRGKNRDENARECWFRLHKNAVNILFQGSTRARSFTQGQNLDERLCLQGVT